MKPQTHTHTHSPTHTHTTKLHENKHIFLGERKLNQNKCDVKTTTYECGHIHISQIFRNKKKSQPKQKHSKLEQTATET